MQEEQKQPLVENAGEQNNENKDKKKFQEGFKRLMNMLNGNESIFRVKVTGASVPGLIEKLTETRRKKAEEDFLIAASALLDKKVEFDRDVAKKRRAFEEAIAAQEKDFLKAMNDVFGLIENFNDIQKSYAETFDKLTGKE